MSQLNAPSASRPPSSLSTRPSSSASYRTASRISSHRPTSRISQRPPTRQSARVSQQCHDLVTQIIGLSPIQNEDEYAEALDVVTKRIDAMTKQAVGLDMKEAEMHLKRLATKARIQSRDELSEALKILTDRIHGEAQKKRDLDTELNISKIPDHLQFLILLSLPPSEETLNYADQIVELARYPPPPASELTWKKIYEEEPLEGEHWRGAYGLPPGAIAEEWVDNESTDSSPLLTPDSDMADLNETLSSIESDSLPENQENHNIHETSPASPHPAEGIQQRIYESLRLREELETLQRRQYWRSSWRTDANPSRPFSLDIPSTLGPTAIVGSNKVNGIVLHDLQNERFIHEHDAVREVLMALQGQENLLFSSWNDSSSNIPKVKISSSAPNLLHLSPIAQRSILEGFAEVATTTTQLKRFCQNINNASSKLMSVEPNSRPSQTLEAFAESVANYLCQIDAWCSQREEIMLRASEQRTTPTIVSLLNLSETLRESFSDTFTSLRDVLFRLFPPSSLFDREAMLHLSRRSPALTACRLLDALFEIAQARQSFRDNVSASVLMQIFVATAEPTWRMLGRWIRDGIFMQDGNSTSNHTALPPEFFIESNDITLSDPDFWSEGYQLRSSLISDSEKDIVKDKQLVPDFLVSVANQVLSAGKSVGLLRILGKSASQSEGTLSAMFWPAFKVFLCTHTNNISPSSVGDFGTISPYDISLILSERLLPACSAPGKLLQSMILTDCDFLYHLTAVEDLYLMRKGDLMSDFCDALFSRIDSRQMWTDYHFLNTTFRDTVSLNKTLWIETSCVRLSYKAPTYSRAVRSLSGLTVDYEAPYPLIYIFNKRTLETYNAIFVFLLQIRRAKAALDNILVRNSTNNSLRSYDELKIFYGTRNKLSWFVNTLSTFINQYVLQIGLRRFHHELESVKSLDDILALHDNHLDRLQRGCLLGEKEKGIHQGVMSILDNSLLFSDFFTAFAGDTTFDASRVSHSHSRRHRSRRLRRENRNVVSFSDVVRISEDSDSSDSDIDESVVPEDPPAESVMMSFATPSFIGGEGDFIVQNDKMTNTLDQLIRFIRRGVEKVALSADRIEAFDTLAFALQDWDL